MLYVGAKRSLFGLGMGRMGGVGANPYQFALMIDGTPVLLDGYSINFS